MQMDNQNPQAALSLTPKSSSSVSTPFQKQTYGTAEFPQPYIAGYGYVTSGGAMGSFFLSSFWSVSKTGTGAYTITHNIGDLTYFVSLTPTIATATIMTVDTVGTNTVTIKSFDAAGAAQDTAFSFIIYKVLL